MNIHQLIAADPNVSDDFKAAMGFRPRCGRWGRVYPTQAAADAYDVGYREYPTSPLGAIGSPEWTGNHDAAADQDARDEMRLEQAQEARGEE
jgi:hypothetical protein